MVILVTACAAAGCTTVSPSPAPAPAARTSAPWKQGTDVPDTLTVTPPPDHEVLATVRPDPVAGPSPSAAPPHRATPPVPGRRPARPARPEQRPRKAHAPTVSLPGGPGICTLGERYGGWPSGSPASRICRGAYGR